MSSPIAYSIYIPRLPVKVTEYDIAVMFNNYEIGNVERIDFNALGKKPGFAEEPEGDYKVAFVHIGHFHNSQIARNVKNTLELGECYRLQTSERNFWMLLKASNPIKSTKMNIHQIVDNCRYLEGLVEKQAQAIDELTKAVTMLQEQVSNMTMKAEDNNVNSSENISIERIENSSSLCGNE
jgi:hypothetical protein